MAANDEQILLRQTLSRAVVEAEDFAGPSDYGKPGLAMISTLYDK